MRPTDCKLQETGGGWWCPTCDEDKEHLLTGNWPRRCRIREAPSSSPPTVTERLDAKYDLDLATRAREQTETLLAICETNNCGQFDSACKLCKRIATGGCSGMERWILYLTDAQKWCEHWGPKPKQQCRSGRCGRSM